MDNMILCGVITITNNINLKTIMKKSIILTKLNDYILNLLYYDRVRDLNYFKTRIKNFYNVGTINESKVCTYSCIHNLDIKYINGIKTSIIECERPGVFIGIKANNINHAEAMFGVKIEVKTSYLFTSRPSKSIIRTIVNIFNNVKCNIKDYIDEITPQQKQFIKESIIVVITMILFFLTLYLLKDL